MFQETNLLECIKHQLKFYIVLSN